MKGFLAVKMIPKVIHYCWFGGNPIPDRLKKCMDSWKKNCPGYEIREWNETNFEISSNKYCKEAYEAKKWAFVSDYARLKIIYENGGIYLDTDVEVIKDLSILIDNGVGFLGFQNKMEVNTGLGFAAEKGNKCVKAMLDIYSKRSFLGEGGKHNLIPCPASNTVGLLECGLRIGKDDSSVIQELQGINVYPKEYFNPLDFDTFEIEITENTYLIHRYEASWSNVNLTKRRIIKKVIPNFILAYRTSKLARKNMEYIRKEIKM